MAKGVNVVCLGAGFVSVYLERVLRKACKNGDVDLSIINRENFHTLHGLLPEMVTGKVQPNTITSPARKLFPHCHFYCAEVESVNWEDKTVEISRELDGKEFIIPYDHLVVGVGTNDNLSHYPGLEENAFRLRNYSDAFKLRNHIPQMLELADIESNPEERQRLLTFVIAGGNYAGVEVCSELATYREQLKKKGTLSRLQKEFRIILLHAGDIVLPELSSRFPGLGKYAEKELQKSGIEIRYETRITAATPEQAITNANDPIPTRTIISCTGMKPNPLIASWNFETDKFGRLITNEYLNVIGKGDIWAGGDCAAVPHPHGNYCPPLALYAMNSGKIIGKNILNKIEKKPLVANRFSSFADACSLGNHKAVGQVWGVPLKGYTVWVAWRLCMFAFMPTIDRRLRMAADYFVGMFTSRDIIDLQTDHRMSIQQKYYEKGQEIIKSGEYGNSMFFIIKGELDVYVFNPQSKEKELVSTLTEGSHFGEVAVFHRTQRTATVIAKTPVTLLELKREAAILFSKIFSQINETPIKKPMPGEARDGY